jgi:hypothetical protein
MLSRLPKLLPAAVLLGLILALTTSSVPAQDPLPLLPPPGTQPVAAAQPAESADPNEPEVLARGPVHEAFATTAEAPTASPVVAKQPPDPIEELPPDQKPEGDNVQWISGYWHWDDDASQFIWISGFWRNTPPGRVWVPGSWREARGGWQWVQGFWQEAPPPQQQQQQPELQYLPQPPESLEIGPSAPALTTTSFYVPGSWVWNRGRFAWRTGFWIEHRPGWIWVPAHFRWTPVGYIFVDGYWDYPLGTRGVLFAPMYFPRPIYAQPAFVYTPTYVVSEPCMVGALFVRRGYGNYFFGDYFAPRYGTLGFNAWCGTIGPRGGFAIGFGVGRTWGYDPLWSYYSVAYRGTPAWSNGVSTLYGGRYSGTVARPPVNLVQQNTVINNITNVNVKNVTNNVTVVNKTVTVNKTNVTDVAMLAPVKVAKDLQPEAKVQAINAQARKAEADNSKQVREVGVQRKKLETAAAAKPVVKATDPPQTLKLDVPKTVAARAVIKDQTLTPPANPHRDIKAATKVDPKIDLKPDVHPVFDPKTNPRIDPKLNPKIDLTPKVDPKVKIDPKVDPKVDPKGKDPLPKVDPNPKIDPKGKIDPLPKIDPKLDPKGKDPLPKIDPKGKDPLPKIDPKGKDPKVDPKGKDPKDKDKEKDKDKGDPKKDPPPPPPPSSVSDAGLRSRLPALNVNPVPRVGPVVNNPLPARQPVFNPPVNNAKPVLPKVQPATPRPPVIQPKVNPPRPQVQPKLPVTQPRVVQPRTLPQPKAPAAKPDRTPKQRDKDRT